MTPEQLAELQTAWPGDWQKTSEAGGEYELWPIGGFWSVTAMRAPWITGATAAMSLRQRGQRRFVVAGTTPKNAAVDLGAELDQYLAELASLRATFPGAPR